MAADSFFVAFLRMRMRFFGVDGFGASGIGVGWMTSAAFTSGSTDGISMFTCSSSSFGDCFLFAIANVVYINMKGLNL